MKQKQWTQSISVIMAVVFLAVTGCAGQQTSSPAPSGTSQDSKPAAQAPAPAPQPKTLRLAHNLPADHHLHKASVVFKDEVEKLSNGLVKVDIYPAGQLYKENDFVPAVTAGAVEMGLQIFPAWSSLIPEAAIQDFPFLLGDWDDAAKALDGETGKYLAARIEEQGVKFLGYMDFGAADAVVNTVRALVKPEDAKGIKIRTFTPLMAEVFKGLGAAPVVMGAGDVYLALQRGTINGAISGATTHTVRKWYEVTKFYTIIPFSYSTLPFVINKKVWDSLAPEQQNAITQAADIATKSARKMARVDAQTAEDIIKNAGMPINRITGNDMQVWRDATWPIAEKYLKETAGDKGQKIFELAQKDVAK